MARGKGPFALTQEEYVPTVDPSAPVKVRYARDASGAFTGTFNKQVLPFTLAPDGRWETVEVSLGENPVTFRRAHVSGSL